MKLLDAFSVIVGLIGMAGGIADILNGRLSCGTFLIALGMFNFFLGVHNIDNRNRQA